MKRFIVQLFVIVYFVNSLAYAFDSYNPNPLNLDIEEYERIVLYEYGHAVYELRELGIIRESDKWEKGDLIKRRDAFEMCYVVYNEGCRRLCTYDDLNKYENLIKNGQIKGFVDIELQSYDCALAIALADTFLLFHGKINENNEKTAAFDDALTYGEALTVVSRLLAHDLRFGYLVHSGMESYSDNPYFDMLLDMGLINSNTPVGYSSLTVDPKKLDEPITAYEFILLLNNAMYVPHLASSDYGGRISGYRYINYATARSWLDEREDFVCIP